ncbi:MAG: SH3-like domain-containing protein [Rhodospirillaceae bacterium]
MSQLFHLGDRVRVIASHPPGHRRTPYYCRGKIGQIERVCGEHRNPEELAYGFDGMPLRRLYRVRFKQSEIWDQYKGQEHDTVDIDIYEHWLRPA